MLKGKTAFSSALTVLGLTAFALVLAVVLPHFSGSPETILFVLPPAGLSLCALCLFLRFLRQEQAEERRMTALAARIPGFICRFRYDGGLTLLNYSDGLLRLTGYTAAELHHRFHNQMIGLIAEPDRQKMWQSMLEQLNRSNTLELRYRLIKKDGCALWVQEKGILSPGGGLPEFYGVFMEIDASQKVQENLRENLERYQTAVRKCGGTIFEYSPDTGRARCLSGQTRLFGCAPDESFPRAMVKTGGVHPDDAENFLALFEKIRTGLPDAQGDFRLKTGEAPFSWYRIHLAAIDDDAGNPAAAIGQISDITTQKLELRRLLLQAQRDELTGLLNRAAAVRLMDAALAENCRCALMMIDIDRFKEINDSRGHLAGDSVLEKTGALLKGLFRATDLTARLGGDEFAVLLCGVTDRAAIAEKAADVQSALGSLGGETDAASQVQCSIGVACAPEDGTCFQALYEKADEALYRAKRSGRNRCCFCSQIGESETIL